MIESAKVLYNKIGNDEQFTPDYGVLPILKHIEIYRLINNIKTLKVWTPFDIKDESKFIDLIRGMDNVEVIHSHIFNDEDFFKYEPEEWDVIVSNPPFKGKRAFFERALSFNKPFALLMTNTALNDKYPLWSFEEVGKQFQILKFDKRIKYLNNDGRANNKITFSSSYFCCDFLQKDFVQEELKVF